MKSLIRKSIPAALTATLVAGAAVTLPAMAATQDEATEEPTTDDAEDDGARHPRGLGLRGTFEDGEFAAALAEELDLDAETVQDAIDAVRADAAAEGLATAVEEGRLTQDQADRITAALEEGDREAAGEVVREARLAALEQRLDERVEAGELTREEADERLERAESGELRGRRGHGGRGKRSAEVPTEGDAGDVAADATAA